MTPLSPVSTSMNVPTRVLAINESNLRPNSWLPAVLKTFQIEKFAWFP